MAESANRPPSPRGGFRRALLWWAVTGAFLGGLVVGALVTGLLSEGGGVPPTTVTAAPTRTEDSPPARADPTDAGATGEVVVNGACLRALNAAQDMLDVVQDLGEALAQFNAARLDEIVRRLQPLERRLGENADECEVQGRVPTGTGSTGTTAPSPTGSTSAPSTD